MDDLFASWPEVERWHFLTHSHNVAEYFDLDGVAVCTKLLVIGDAHWYSHERAFGLGLRDHCGIGFLTQQGILA